MTEQTIIIFTDTGEMFPRYFVVPGDFRHLHEVLINGDSDEELVDQLNTIVYDEKWNYNLNHDKFPTALLGGDVDGTPVVHVIHAGFIA